MSPFPEDDEDLTQFLQCHRSTPPPAAPDLEDRIIQSLPRRSSVSRPLVLFVSGIAACFVGIIIAQPVRSPSVDAQALEAFMENNWSGVMEGASTSDMMDYVAFVESNSNN